MAFWSKGLRDNTTVFLTTVNNTTVNCISCEIIQPLTKFVPKRLRRVGIQFDFKLKPN